MTGRRCWLPRSWLPRSWLVLLALLASMSLAGCGAPAAPAQSHSTRPAGPSSEATGPAANLRVPEPGPLKQPLLSSDVLVVSKDTLSRDVVARIGDIAGVTHTETFSLGQFFFEETGVTYAAVDPETFRRLTPPGTAQTLDVWRRVADGELAISPGIGHKIADDRGFVTLGASKDSPQIHVGAFAQITPTEINPATRIDAVLNKRWVQSLHMKPDNAMIFSMGSRSPQSILKRLRAITGSATSVQILGPDLDTSVAQTAVLTGGSVAAAVGSFTYTVAGGGRVIPEASWVRANIRTETLPVVGTVRCHKVMLDQLRLVMLEIQRQGLSKSIYDYGGCYVPRYIAGSSTLSFHSFGTAIDLNVQDNLRGGPGKMDRRVVAIFKRFGFGWGGDWAYTDPMHFELVRLVKAG